VSKQRGAEPQPTSNGSIIGGSAAQSRVASFEFRVSSFEFRAPEHVDRALFVSLLDHVLELMTHDT
jgi:hypothetical protein